MDILLQDKNKIVDIVDSLKKNKPEGGANFFDRMDEFARDPKNVSMVYHLIDKIRQEQNQNFNLIITGKFGDWVFNLIKTGKIKINGVVIHVSGSLRSSFKNKTFQIIGGNEDRVYNTSFVLLDDSYYSGSTKREIDKHLIEYGAKITKTYVFYDGSFQRKSDVYSVYRYYDYHIDDILPIKTLTGVLNNMDEDYIPYDLLENQIMRGQIRSVKELLKEIQILKQKFQKSGDRINIKSYGYKREYESKMNKKFKDFINESIHREFKYTTKQFFDRYKKEGRENIRLLLRGRILEFKTKTKGIGKFKGKIRGLFISNSNKRGIFILFNTKYGTLEVDNNYPLMIKDEKTNEGIRWYSNGKLGQSEGDDYGETKFSVGDRLNFVEFEIQL